MRHAPAHADAPDKNLAAIQYRFAATRACLESFSEPSAITVGGQNFRTVARTVERAGFRNARAVGTAIHRIRQTPLGTEA
eukprot:6998292-Pyramimonas_sp.AAC.1